MASPWEAHRRRAEALRSRYPFAAEVLALYLALIDVWEESGPLTLAERPEPEQLAGWAAERVLPGVVKATEAAGPPPLVEATYGLVEAGELAGSLARWLAGAGLPPVERYLARASLRAPLEALGAAAGQACAADTASRGGSRCPTCAGPPQLTVRQAGEDRLVSAARRLICARCAHDWQFSSSTCPFCGETSGSKRTVYAEPRGGPVVAGAADPPGAEHDDRAGPATFPHLRVDACASCRRYLIDVDLGRDPRAVPEVDELAAVPLDLYATEQGLSKITPNLMGF